MEEEKRVSPNDSTKQTIFTFKLFVLLLPESFFVCGSEGRQHKKEEEASQVGGCLAL